MLNHENQLIKYIASFTLSNNFSYMTVNLMNILYKQSISYEKLYCNQHIKINCNVEYISCIKELIFVRNQLCVNFNDKEIRDLLNYFCIE